MSEAVDRSQIHTTIEKSLLEQFRRLFCRRKGDLAYHLENAMRMYILSHVNGEAHTHPEHPHINFMDMASNRLEKVGGKSCGELEAMVMELSNMVSVGGRLAKPLIMQAIARATGLKDRRSISSRILILESYGVIRRDPELPNVYEVVSLPLQLNRNFK